mmetsp:Transcript_16128/g.41808  ORF Transcript_16128/g.41808 Transcript_16128/m.41808 type:complete len:177 (+) Transcript_16128:1065-1595(+)
MRASYHSSTSKWDWDEYAAGGTTTTDPPPSGYIKEAMGVAWRFDEGAVMVADNGYERIQQYTADLGIDGVIVDGISPLSDVVASSMWEESTKACTTPTQKEILVISSTAADPNMKVHRKNLTDDDAVETHTVTGRDDDDGTTQFFPFVSDTADPLGIMIRGNNLFGIEPYVQDPLP